MKSKRIILPVVIVAICIILVVIWVTVAIKGNSNKQSFQSEAEMSEVLNGTWRTGDSEFDFILTVSGEIASISMDNKDDEPNPIILVPEKGYFYFEKDEDIKEERYYVVKNDGLYSIENRDWIFKKVKKIYQIQV